DEMSEQQTAHTAIGRYFMTSSEALDALWRVLASPLTGSVVVSTGNLDARLRTWTGPRVEPPREARSAAGVDYVPPQSDVEEAIVRLWKEVLGVQQIGVHDSFFALGGDS